MKYKFLLLFFITFNIYCQNSDSYLLINYTHSIQLEGSPSKTVVEAVLLTNQSYSLYEMDFVGNSNILVEEGGDNGAVLNIKPTSNPKIYKEAQKQNIYSVERIGMNPFLVKDLYTVFNWTLKEDFKEILGYNCQKAVMNYRGREYVGYFTTSLPYNNGPWKFANLPGMILEIKSVDGVFEIEANKIIMNNLKSTIEYPFKIKKENALTWKEFIGEYKKKYIELLHYRAPDGGTMSIPKRKIEVLIEN